MFYVVATSAPSAMSTFMQNVSDIVASVIDMLGDWVTAITSSGNELILMAVLLPIVFIGIRALRLLMGQSV